MSQSWVYWYHHWRKSWSSNTSSICSSTSPLPTQYLPSTQNHDVHPARIVEIHTIRIHTNSKVQTSRSRARCKYLLCCCTARLQSIAWFAQWDWYKNTLIRIRKGNMLRKRELDTNLFAFWALLISSCDTSLSKCAHENCIITSKQIKILIIQISPVIQKVTENHQEIKRWDTAISQSNSSKLELQFSGLDRLDDG